MITKRGFEGVMIYTGYKLIPTPYQLPLYVGIVNFDLDKIKSKIYAKSAFNRLGRYLKQYTFWTYWRAHIRIPE